MFGKTVCSWRKPKLKSVVEQAPRVDDLVVIPNADFSTASNRHTFSEESLFHSHWVYFYVVTAIGQRTITLQYAGRIEPLDTHPVAEFTTLLHLLPRDSITLPLDLDGNWVIATTRGAKLVQVLFPGTANDSSSRWRWI